MLGLNRFNARSCLRIESIQSMELKMIPASYLFKTVYRDAWGVDLAAAEPKQEEQIRTIGSNGFRRLVAITTEACRALAGIGGLLPALSRLRNGTARHG
ncbi:MAG: hypothetical protein ABI377_10895 [Devosia sp.]